MLKKIVNRMLCMHSEAWYIFIRSLILCCLLNLCAAALLKEWGGSMSSGYDMYMTAVSLTETAQAVLLIGTLGSVIIEAFQS